MERRNEAMKKKTSKILSLIMAFAVAFSMIIIPQTLAVHADGSTGQPVNYTTKTATLATGYYNVNLGKRYNSSKDKIRVSTSNKRVVAIEDKSDPSIQLKKPGKATVTFTVYKKSGAKKSYKMKIKAVKYQNPFKSVKIGSKEYRSKFKNDVEYELEMGSGKYKVSVVPAKGWKIEKITHGWYGLDENDEFDFSNPIEKKIKNKGTISISKNKTISWLNFYMYNTKTGCKELIDFSIYNIDIEF